LLGSFVSRISSRKRRSSTPPSSSQPLFAVILGCFKILEETVVGLFHGKFFNESITAIGGGTLQGTLSLLALLAVLLIPFFGFTELRRVFGEGKLEKLFFTSRHPAASSS
jgi:hypothetical protein